MLQNYIVGFLMMTLEKSNVAGKFEKARLNFVVAKWIMLRKSNTIHWNIEKEENEWKLCVITTDFNS